MLNSEDPLKEQASGDARDAPKNIEVAEWTSSRYGLIEGD
jgi:hypothetical protein